MKKNVKKVILTVLSVALIVALSVTATLAWLQDTTDPVVNTFTEGKVDIDLFEHKYDAATKELTTEEVRNGGNSYKMVPGEVLPKDPTVVVKGGSEACWLFVKVEELNNVDTFLSYTIDASKWTQLPDVEGVYYTEITTYTANDTLYNVLTDKQVTVNTSVDIDDMNALTEATHPQLKFTAYAIQKQAEGNATFTAETAWAALNPPAAG